MKNIETLDPVAFNPTLASKSRVSIGHAKALQIILKAEKSSELSPLQREELQAIVSHWLHTPDASPILLDEFFKKKWLDLLHAHCLRRVKKSSSELTVDVDSCNSVHIDFSRLPFPPVENPQFTFIDLFAGIGGFRQAMQKEGGKCVFSSEWDKYAKKTYLANYGETPYGDICKIDANAIPDHNVLCAGFPCQPFSLAGVSKKNSLGRKHGFEDETQGTLFFNLANIINIKRPDAFFLENVKNLLRHRGGETFEVIRRTLEDELKYVVHWCVVDAAKWVPQHRERLFIVGYNPDKVKGITKDKIVIPTIPDGNYKFKSLKSIIQKEFDSKHILGPGTWKTLKRHKKHHKKEGNGFGYGLHRLPIKKNELTRTISARYHKDGAEILIECDSKRPRRLAVKEAMQLQGYDPKKFNFNSVSDTQAYRQIGNSVAVPAVQATAKEIANILIKDSL